MASYHLAVKTIKRSAGRSATAAAAYRSAGAIFCEREGRLHDYSRKGGVAESFIVLPEGAPDWAGDRAALWNAAEATETRSNSVTAREWELALPAEISEDARREIAHGFAAALVERYGVVADVSIHAPHREGDQRNHHAHVLTSTRRLEPEGFGAKTRVLDAARTGGPEIEVMRGLWSELQNAALERAGEAIRVDHRSLEAQREAALARGDELAAEELTRAPEIKLGPAANAMERREHAGGGGRGPGRMCPSPSGAVRCTRSAKLGGCSWSCARSSASAWSAPARPMALPGRRGGTASAPASLPSAPPSRSSVASTKTASAGPRQESVRERLQRILERDAARQEAVLDRPSPEPERPQGRGLAPPRAVPEPKLETEQERPGQGIQPRLKRILGRGEAAAGGGRARAAGREEADRPPEPRAPGRPGARERDDGWER